MTHRSTLLSLLAVAVPLAALQAASTVPRERILPDLVANADGTVRKLARANATYGCRELFTSMLAYAEARTNLQHIATLLAYAEDMQDKDPSHRSYGNFRWYSRDSAVQDYNAVDFCMQHGALLWRFHRDALDPAVRARLLAMLKLGRHGLVKHLPPTTYTNIALLNASDLILLGEALGDAAAAAEGERRLGVFVKTLWEEGAHEYVSPTYYGVDVESMMLVEALASREEARAIARAILAHFWTDIALNWYAPGQRLAGTHSRTYDYVFGFGELDQVLTAAGWLPLPETASKTERPFRFTTFTPLYARAQAPSEALDLGDHYPRLVEQTWGSAPFRARTHYVCRDVTLGTSWCAYGGRMDIALAADFPGDRGARLPRLSFIPDGRHDPYGKKAVFDGKTHSKAFHLAPWWAGVQDHADALGVAVYRDTDFQDATGTLESHLLFRKSLDSLWIDDVRLALGPSPLPSQRVPPGSAVFLRQGTGVIAIRVPWTRGQDGAACPSALVDDGNPFGALRLTVTHAWLDPTNHPSRVQAGVAFWLRVGSGLSDDDAFAAFRREFCRAGARVSDSTNALAIEVDGAGRKLSISAKAPFDRDPATSPQPPRITLGLDGNDLGRATLEACPVVRRYVEARRPASPIAVSAGQPTVWESEQATLSVPYEVATDDPSASQGTYLWVPEIDGVSGGGSGQAVYALAVEHAGRYRLAARVLTPSPDDDSFFLSARAENGAEILPETAWSPGIFKRWTWRDVTAATPRRDAVLELPQGRSTLTLRSREAGAKIDQFRLTPVAE